MDNSENNLSLSNNANNQNNNIDTSNNDINTDELLTKSFSYPEPNDPNLLYKLLKKREYYYNKSNLRPDLDKYEDIYNYRKDICELHSSLYNHQVLLSNIINPNTPYKGMLIFHGLGSGKTCVGVAIAEKFKEQVKKYNTKIHILTSGPLIKESWKYHLTKCTGNTYKENTDNISYLSKEEQEKLDKNALLNALQYYDIISYKSFYKRVLGEKIIDKTNNDNLTIKSTYRKNEEGEFERDIAINRIYNLNNSIIIIDEAHNLTGNAYGDALKYIIKNSINLRVVLLTATPMKNLGDDIIELLNFIRPLDSPILRDKIFSNDKNHEMTLKPGGLDYFQKMAKGYVSHVRGADPVTYAMRIDKGIIPKGLLFTKVVKCKMMKFQKKMYNYAVKHFDDALDRKSEAVANFVFPGLSTNRKNIVGYFGRNGLNVIINQLKSEGNLLNNLINKTFFENKESNSIIQVTNNKIVSGKIFKLPYLKYFSIKFYKAMKKINRLFNGKKGARTAFVYSNLVKVGIEIFQEILLQNGYLEYQEDIKNYNIQSTTKCYFCGKTYSECKQSNQYGGESESIDIEEDDDSQDVNLSEMESNEEYSSEDITESINNFKISESSSEYKKPKNPQPIHKFYPATFITITGKQADDIIDDTQEEKKKILDNVFNKLENKEGKFIKLVLGSKVMNEGISLKNVSEVHILDVYYNLGKVDQVVGRAIRYCSHYQLMNENNVYPKVNVYKYVVSLDDKLSTEEELYKKAEQKYILIKKIERSMKEVAIDCPLNLNNNIFKEEIEKYKDCTPYKNPNMCPTICDYTKCYYKCKEEKLNSEYYDPNRKLYKNIKIKDLDLSTFTQELSRNEIDNIKILIKEMYIIKNIYKLSDIIKYIKNNYDKHKKELFDEFFVFKALDELIPTNTNDFNNFKDIIINKYNIHGYLIYRNKYYIFQSFNQNEKVPMHYRNKFDKNIKNKLSLYNYLKNSNINFEQSNKDTKLSNIKNIEIKSIYDFESIMDYYDNRDEFKYVGIVDKNKKNDIFKIREKRNKVLEKKRGTGIPSLKGAVCATSKNKEYLVGIAKKLNINTKNISTRLKLCEKIKEKMLYNEKYSTTKDKNKFTYIMIPKNHPIYEFPYNLEDRVNYIIEELKNNIKFKLNINIKKNKLEYVIKVTCSQSLKDYKNLFKKYNIVIKDKELLITVK